MARSQSPGDLQDFWKEFEELTFFSKSENFAFRLVAMVTM